MNHPQKNGHRRADVLPHSLPPKSRSSSDGLTQDGYTTTNAFGDPSLPYSYLPMHPPFSAMPSVEMMPHLAGMDPLQAQVFVSEVNRAIDGGIAPLAAIGMGLAMSFGQFYPAASSIFVQSWQATVKEVYGIESGHEAEHVVEPTINVFVKGLDITATNESFQKFCVGFPGFSHGRAIQNNVRKECKGYGFAHFFDVETARAFIKAVNTTGYRASFAWNQAAAPKRSEPFSSVHINRLPSTWQEMDLLNEISHLKPVGLRILRDPTTRKSKGCAILRFDSRAGAEVALVQLQLRIFDPNQGKCRVRLSQEWAPSSSGQVPSSMRRKEQSDIKMKTKIVLQADDMQRYRSHFQPKEPNQTINFPDFATYADAAMASDKQGH